MALSAASLGVLLLLALSVNTLALLTGRRNQPTPVNPPVVAAPKLFPSPASIPTIGREHDYGPAPLTVPMFWYVDPREPTWMVGAGWNGKPQGTLKVSQPIGNNGGYGGGLLSISPDGSRIILGQEVVDARGRIAGAALPGGKVSYQWADDSRHLCRMSDDYSQDATGIPQTLMTLLPGTQPRSVAKVGAAYSQAGAGPYACSFLSGQALVVQTYNDVASESWLVNLLTGEVIHHQTFLSRQTPETIVRVRASHDGAYVAENTTITGQGGASATAGPSVVRSGTTGARLATMPAGTEVAGFSWDGSLAVLVGAAVTRTSSEEIIVVDWRSGRVVWKLGPGRMPFGSAPLSLDQVLPGPGGKEFALSLQTVTPCASPEPSSTGQGACGITFDTLENILLVLADGTPVQAAAGVHPLW